MTEITLLVNLHVSIICEYYCQSFDKRINRKMSEKRESKKRKCNDKKEKELSLRVQEGKREYTIGVLNYHCLEEIISYLDPVDRLNLEKLCEKTQIASSIAWRRIKDLEMTTVSYAGTIKRCSIQAGGTQEIIKKILVRCGNYLESLFLSFCGKPLMTLVVNKCHNLRKLTIECQSFESKNFKDPFKNMKNLKYLKIKLFKDNDVGMLKSLPEDIEEISIESSRIYGGACLPFVLPEDFENFSKKWKALRSLSLNSFIITKTANIIFNKIYPLTCLQLVICCFADMHRTELLISNYKNLKHLQLMSMLGVNDVFINMIANNFKNLESLSIHYCFSVSEEGLKVIAKLKNLNELNIDCTRANDNVLAKFKNLKSLSCKATSVSDTGVIAFLDNSPNLEYLNVSVTPITANTLSHAANLTNCREKKLIIHASKKTIESFEQRIEISPFLDLKDSC